jgi:hypothetical protein
MTEVYTRFENDILDWMLFHFQQGFTDKETNNIHDGFDITSDSFWVKEEYFGNVTSRVHIHFIDNGNFQFQTTWEEREHLIAGNERVRWEKKLRPEWYMYFYVYYDQLDKYLPMLQSRVIAEYMFCPK